MSCRNPCLRLWFLLLPDAKKGQVLILPASAFCYLGPGTRDPRWDLSTLDRAHRRDSFLFVGGDDRDVSFLDGAESSVSVGWIGFVPVTAGEVLLRQGVFEILSVAGVYLIVLLAHVFQDLPLVPRPR